MPNARYGPAPGLAGRTAPAIHTNNQPSERTIVINKRDFVASVGLAGVMLPAANAIAAPGNKAGNAQPALLTVSGAIGKPNRGEIGRAHV